MIYCVDETLDEPIMLINAHIGYDVDEGMGIDGALFQKELMQLDSLGKKRIQVWINSVGGIVVDGYSIASAILKTKTPVDTYNVGLSASIAGVIFMCGRNRVMMDYAQLMIHPVSGSVDDKSTESFENSLTILLSAKSDITQEKVSELMSETTWIDAEEALSKGFATEIEYTENINKKRLNTKNIAEFLSISNKLIIQPKKIKTMLKVANKLGLNDDASEESILAEISKIENKAKCDNEDLKKEMDALKEKHCKEMDALKAKYDDSEEENAKNMIQSFVTNGKLTGEEAIVNQWVAQAKNDFKATKALLESLPVNKIAAKIEISKQGAEPQLGDYFREKMKLIKNKK